MKLHVDVLPFLVGAILTLKIASKLNSPLAFSSQHEEEERKERDLGKLEQNHAEALENLVR